MLLSVMVGNGAQLCAMVGVTLGRLVIPTIPSSLTVKMASDQYSLFSDFFLHPIVDLLPPL